MFWNPQFVYCFEKIYTIMNIWEEYYNWEKFNETLLPEKEDFYTNLNMENVTDTDCAQEQKFVKILK